ncbi:hypothetical protein SAMN02745121_03260 [Nannocystis exedens]|uniref:Uncharacterized protein n=1 Tax=Nannocystis exedens TaxID=54 RepID=A0A1I1Y9J8_9BACT|nr:hypothetical protein [Nannocystis exedens]PCC71910.1 hypothetical protein NAEX_04989 [Nannocystis exedens]SFE16234.1 hypothetical protein SAMN02745121_03260 [Nannocystis exedens]
MRRWLVGGSAALLAACLPLDPEYLVTAPLFRGVRVEVVEPGGYASLLHVPDGRRRATILPLDTVELTASFAAPPGVTVQPPIWLVCGLDCVNGVLPELVGDLAECPVPLPLNLQDPCRLAAGHRIRLSIAGAFTLARQWTTLVLVGSRDDDLTPAACLERLTHPPHTELEPCIISLWSLGLGPLWALLPFDVDASDIPPEILEQEVDTNPDVAEFRVTRERGGSRSEQRVAPGGSVGVRRGDRITVEPIFTEGSAQTWWYTYGDEEDKPWSGELESAEEQLLIRAWFDAPVLDFAWTAYDGWTNTPITWTVPHDVVPTRLFLDVNDFRDGRAAAELLFVADDAP